MTRPLSLFLFLSFCTLSLAAASPSSETSGAWEWFSDKPREVKPLYADPREAQTHAGFLMSGNQHNYLDIGLGGHVGVARAQEGNQSMSLTARALMTARFQFQSRSFDLQNGDFIGGAAASYRSGPHAFEFLIFHQSSHLGDDLIVQGAAPINYSFEAARVLYSRDLGETARVYTGVEVKVRADPRRLFGKTTAIVGADWHFLQAVPELFTAFDLRFRQEYDFDPCAAFMLGYELGDLSNVKRRQRIILEVFNGNSNLGQFDKTKEFYVMLGFGFNL